jgi:hypothetical protein
VLEQDATNSIASFSELAGHNFESSTLSASDVHRSALAMRRLRRWRFV